MENGAVGVAQWASRAERTEHSLTGLPVAFPEWGMAWSLGLLSPPVPAVHTETLGVGRGVRGACPGAQQGSALHFCWQRLVSGAMCVGTSHLSPDFFHNRLSLVLSLLLFENSFVEV